MSVILSTTDQMGSPLWPLFSLMWCVCAPMCAEMGKVDRVGPPLY